MRFSLFFLISGNWLGMLREAAFFSAGLFAGQHA